MGTNTSTGVAEKEIGIVPRAIRMIF